MRRPRILQTQVHQLLGQRGLLGLGLINKYECLPPWGITALLLLGAAGKMAYFLLHSFRALAVFRQAFRQFLLLVSLNLSRIARSFALAFYCLFRVGAHAFGELRPGSELARFEQLF